MADSLRNALAFLASQEQEFLRMCRPFFTNVRGIEHANVQRSPSEHFRVMLGKQDKRACKLKEKLY
jgi:hypothetical protein